MTSRHEVTKKKKKIPIFYTHVSSSFLSDMSGYAPICTGLCTSPISCYVFLSGWESLSTMRLYIHPPAATGFSLSSRMKSTVFGSTQSSLLISAISSSLWAPSSPLPQISSHPPPNSTQVNTFPHKFTSHSSDSTSLPLPCAYLPHYSLHSALSHALHYFFLFSDQFPHFLIPSQAAWSVTTPLLIFTPTARRLLPTATYVLSIWHSIA